jgi:predicted CXXCH cytochrome family protein
MLALLLLAACSDCHKAQTEHFAHSAMAKALSPAKDIPALKGSLGRFSYEVAGSTLSVTDGKDTVKTPLQWSFGAGTVGQTWLYERGGRWYESRVSYYKSLNGLALTIGQQPPASLAEAPGRLTSVVEAKACFHCHGSERETITCERCHGPDAHDGKLKRLGAEAMSDFCGQCHRTWAQIAANGPRGIQNIRFQPYRLALSKCANLRCADCHEPHSELAPQAAYDSKCAACHQSCRAGETQNCVSCHMPRLELPGANARFTDHRIRVVKPNERYPD